MSPRHTYDVLRSAMLAGLLLWSGVSAAQEPAGPTEASSAASLNDSVHELRQQIRELQAAVSEIRTIPRGDHRVAAGTSGGAHGFDTGQSGRGRGCRRNQCLRSSCRAAGHRSARGSENAARRHSGRGVPALEREGR